MDSLTVLGVGLEEEKETEETEETGPASDNTGRAGWDGGWGMGRGYLRACGLVDVRWKGGWVPRFSDDGFNGQNRTVVTNKTLTAVDNGDSV